MKTFLSTINIRKFLIYSFFFFMPSAYSYPGRAYYKISHLQGYKDFSIPHLLLLPSILLATLLIVERLCTKNSYKISMTQFNTSLLYILFLWFLAATFSLDINWSIDVANINYVAVYYTSLLVYIAFLNLNLTEEEYIGIFIALALGSLFPLISGVIEYYQYCGIPDSKTFIYTHCDLKKMRHYSQATFGNTGNTAAFLMLIIPPFFALLVHEKLKKQLRWLFGIILFLAVINLIIIYSRSAFITLFIASLFITYKRSFRFCIMYALILLLFFISIRIIFPDLFSTSANYLNNAILLNSHDNSVAVRGSAMKIGWQIFLDHFFAGTGPGANIYYNPYTSAHQFNIEQASELGILGFIASILLCLATFIKFIKIIWDKNLKLCYRTLIFIVGPTSYLFYGTLANMPLNIGVVNSWISLMVALLALVENKSTEYLLPPNNHSNYENPHHLRHSP